EPEQHRPAHRKAERDEGRRARVAALLFEDVALHDAPARAAPLLGPRRRDPALLGEDAMPAQQVRARQLLVVGDLVAQVGGQIRLPPAAHRIAERRFFLRIVEVHAASSTTYGGPMAHPTGW